MLASRRTMLTYLEISTKIIHQIPRDLHTTQVPSLSIMVVILASSTPITEHTKLLDCLSETSSQLIHCISHPSKRTYWPNCSICALSASGFHGFASCIPTFCKKDLSVTITADKPSWK